ncbi:MAG: PAS domain S-box protein, partial [Acidobacteriota bacterium]|nr:PAS domain S-box protein [Acidobacteriota bacterium]
MNNEPIKVLLVEDDEDDYLLTRMIFAEIEGVKFELRWAQTFDSALRGIENFEPDVCLVDYRLGEHTGLDFIRECAARRFNVPTVLLTGQGDRAVDIEAMKVGAMDYLVKGQISPPLLERSIRYAVERYKTAEKLQEYAAIVQSSDDAILGKTLEGIITSWNKGAEKMYGYTAEEMVGKSIYTIVPPDRHDELAQILERLKEGETVEHLETVRVSKDGRTINVSVTISPIKDLRGTIIGASAIARDITERKRAEAALQRQSRLIELSFEPILLREFEGGIIEWNTGAEQLYGYTKSEAIGRNSHELLKTIFTVPFDQFRAALEREREWAGELRHTTKEGREVVIESRQQLVDFDGYQLVLETNRDITERKQAEEALRESEQRYRLMFESNPHPMWVFDLETLRFLAVNESAARHYGYTREEFMAMTIKDIRPPEDVMALAESFARMDGGLSSWGIWRHRKKNGQIIQVEITTHTLTFAGRRAQVVLAHDVTERIEADEALKRAEKKYRSIFENAVEGIFQSTPSGKFISVNPAAAQLLGYDSPEELIADRINIMAQHYVDPSCRRELERMLAEQDIVAGFECEVFRKDGSRIWVIENIRAVRDEGGELVYYEGSIEDITERKLAQEKLRESEERFAKAFNSSPMVMVLSSLETGKILEVNETFTGLTGYSREEVVGRTALGLGLWAKPQDRDELIRDIRQLGRVRNLEHVFRTRDGREIIGLISSERIEIGGEAFALTVIQDITGRKLAEEAVREADRRAIIEYERLLERIGALAQSLGTARDLKIIFRALREFALVSTPCNGVFISLYDPERGLRSAAFAWSEGEEVDVSELPPMPMTGSPNSRAITTGEIIITGDFQHALEGQPVINVGLERDPRLPQSSLVVPMSVMGHIVGAVEVQSTEPEAFNQAHATAMKMAANLAANAIENVRLFERERESAEQLRQSQKLEAIGQLAGGVAHDFNNLLTAIMGYSDLTIRRLGVADPLIRNVEEIRKAAERATSLTRQLLAFSRKQVLLPKVINLNSIISDMERMLWRLIGEHIELRTMPANELGQIKADPGQIEQVILNLVVNARDAMPKGGKISIETANVYLDEEYARRHIAVTPGWYAMFAITDTGQGMDEETQKRIFEPFFTTKGEKGTGLGLSTVYGIIKQSGGNIWVYSEVGQGTTFKVYLPSVDEHAAA